jgi:hypothetical protein
LIRQSVGLAHSKTLLYDVYVQNTSEGDGMPTEEIIDRLDFMADPSFFTIVDTYGIELIHPGRQCRSEQENVRSR